MDNISESSDLEKQINTSKPETGDQLYSCLHCRRTYDKKDIFDLHVRTHTREIEGYYQEKFVQLSTIEISGRKGLCLYSCSHCHRAFNNKSVLEGTHMKKCSYKGPTCNGTFKHAVNLESHMRDHSCLAGKNLNSRPNLDG